MSAGHQVRSYDYGQTTPASATTRFGLPFAIETEMRLNLVMDVVLGQVAGTPTLKLQDSTGLNFWNDVKSTTLSASTDKTVTVSGATWTSASHGYTAGQVVTINSTGNVPGGIKLGGIYYVQNPTTNTFQLTTFNSATAAPVTTTDSGTGTLSVTAATVVTLRANVEVAGDQAIMPIRPLGQLVAVCTGGQSVQVLTLRNGFTY